MQQVRWLRQIQLIIKIETIAGKSRMAAAAGERFLLWQGSVIRGSFPAGVQFVSALEEEGLLWMPACAGMTDDAGQAVSLELPGAASCRMQVRPLNTALTRRHRSRILPSGGKSIRALAAVLHWKKVRAIPLRLVETLQAHKAQRKPRRIPWTVVIS